MYQPVEDGVGEGVIADGGIPLVDGQLAGHECGAGVIAVIHDVHEAMALCGVASVHAPVIDDEDLGSRQGVDEFGIASVPFGDAQVLEESGQAQVQGGVAGSTGAVRQGTGEPGFADAGGAGDEDIEVFPDPLAGRQ